MSPGLRDLCCASGAVGDIIRASACLSTACVNCPQAPNDKAQQHPATFAVLSRETV